ncbi:MAG: hypothetical protein KF768_08085 [Phycisphaeraceae bacterium]|nr:hypothetical protein [Phycisphaeraceae bacterium]
MRSIPIPLIPFLALTGLLLPLAATATATDDPPPSKTTDAAPAPKPEPDPAPEPEAPHPLASLRAEALALRPLCTSDFARAMLDQVEHLPVCQPRTLYVATRPNRALTPDQFDQLPEDERAKLRKFTFTPDRYYTTFYGTPLVYARVLDLAADAWTKSEAKAPASLRGKRILDLGYGQLGQLRLWAQSGARVTGVEVDPILTALYADSPAANASNTPGSLRLLECSWPNHADCRASVEKGGPYDLLISRNVLKRGYVKPDKLPTGFPDPVGWNMPDAEVLSHFFNAMNPGGLVVIYSIGPAPDPAKPWSDIANPWPRDAWQAAGFEVLAYDADETDSARAIGKALGWESSMDLDADLFGVYSIYRRPAE